MAYNPLISVLPIDAVINSALDGLIIVDEQAVIQHCNPAAERLLHYNAKELVGNGLQMLLPMPKSNADGQALLRDWMPRRVRSVRCNGGASVSVEIGVSEVRAQEQPLWIVTLRKAIESQQRLQRIIAATQVSVWEYNIAEDKLWVDASIARLLGESLVSDGPSLAQLRAAIHPDDRESVHQAWQRCIQGCEPELEQVYRVQHRDGAWRWIRETGKVTRCDHQGQPSQIAGLYEDVHDKKCAEDTLNRFYALTVAPDLTTEQKIKAVLALGLSYLQLELALVSQSYGDDARVLYHVPEGAVLAPQVLSDACSYCSPVLDAAAVNAWHNAEASERSQDSGAKGSVLGAYIGITLWVKGQAYGTLAFMQQAAREQAFTEREKNMLHLMAQWMASELAQRQGQQQLEAPERFFTLIQDAIPDLIFVKDQDFRIVRANSAFLNLYPAKMRDSVIGSTTIESYDDDEAEAFLAQDKLAFETGSAETEETIAFPDGQIRTLLTKKIRFYDTNDQAFILGIGHDITERKKAQRRLAESEERYQLAVKGSSVGLWDWDVKTGALFWSERFKEIIGISDQDFRPRYEEFAERLHPEDRERIERILFRHVEVGTPYDVEYRLRRVDGSYVWIHARGQAIWDEQGQATRMAGSVDDITLSKLAQDEVMRSNMELERFAYMASHDLQEPLRMVVNFTQLLESKYADQLDQQALEYIQYASNSASRMQALVKDLLEYARIGNEAETHQAIELDSLKASIQESLYDSICQTQAEIEWQPLPKVVADPVRMRSVLQNIIGNAIKYRHPQRVPKIRVSVTTTEQQWLFVITDNGIGMKQAYCEKIFEPFKRLHRKEDYPGTGMGLSICRKSIEGLGGKIWAESTLGKGSTFYFTLPQPQY